MLGRQQFSKAVSKKGRENSEPSKMRSEGEMSRLQTYIEQDYIVLPSPLSRKVPDPGVTSAVVSQVGEPEIAQQ